MRSLFLIALSATAAFAAAPVRPPMTSVSHLAVYAADPAKTEHFYVHDLGAVKLPDPENPAGVRYHFSPTQFVEVLPLPADAGLNRMDHFAFNTADVEAMRKYLASKKVAVPKKVSKGADGSQWIEVRDPEGNRVQFVQAPVTTAIPTDALFPHIIHVGAVVRDRAKQDTFYRDILGFRPYWFGGSKDDGPPQWVSQQVPDGPDWLEYMVTSNPSLTQAQMGVLNHIALGVPNIEAAYTTLWNGDRVASQAPNTVPKIGRDAKWQLNLLDPDGTRAEVMELHAIGKPCCSPFTAVDPEK
jgi:catechol 2,3-dioxygenase-like lactoylglutathione lyase family enzyme